MHLARKGLRRSYGERFPRPLKVWRGCYGSLPFWGYWGLPGDSIAFGKILLYLLFGKADLLLLVGFFLAHHGKDDIRIKSALTGKVTKPLCL